MAYKRTDYKAHDGGKPKKSKKTPKRMRAEHEVIKDSRYKGDYLPEKIADVEDRIEFLREDAHANNITPAKKRKNERAIKRLEKRRDQYRAEYRRQNEKN